MLGVIDSGIREDVLAARFLGPTPAAKAVADFVAFPDRAEHLRHWFGDPWLAALEDDAARASIVRAAIDRDIQAIDTLLSEQLDAILHHPRLTRLEGSWRGLAWLVERRQVGKNRSAIKLFHARWSEVCRDLERAPEFDQSTMFRLIYEEEFGTPGGIPYGLIVADYEIRHKPSARHPTDDILALAGMADIAAAAFAPMLFAASPELLGLDAFGDATPALDIASVFKAPEYQRWHLNAAREQMRFVGVALPRTLGRAPWRYDGSRIDRFCYRSYTPTALERVWSSPSFGFAAVAIRAFERYSWPADIRGADIAEESRGGLIDELPFERFPSDAFFEAPPRAPVDLALTDRQEAELGSARLVPLAALDGLPEVCFAAVPSLHRPPTMSSTLAEANQRLSSQLNSILCAGRFAHCVKLMGREMTGSGIEPQEVQTRLTNWLGGFISPGASRPEETAEFPLRGADVEVREMRGRPGVYFCTIKLQPHHQLDEIGASFKLVTEFVPIKASA